MANPIKRVIQLVLDKRSAQKAEADAKQAIGGIGRGLSRLKTAAVAVGAAIVAAFSIRALVNFGREAVRTAAEAEKSWARLAGTLEGVGVSFQAQEKRIKEIARAMQDATTVGDEQFADTLQTLVAISGDYERSLGNVQVAADVAARYNLDLQTAAMLVGRAMIGNTTLLQRYGIEVSGTGDAVKEMAEQTRGLSEVMANTLSGQLQQVRNEWGDVKEAIGDALIEAGNGAGILETLRVSLRQLESWVRENSDAFTQLGQAFADLIPGAIEVGRVLAGSVTKGLVYAAKGWEAVLRGRAALEQLFGRGEFADMLRADADAIKEWADGVNEAADSLLNFKVAEASAAASGANWRPPVGGSVPGAGGGGGAGGPGAGGSAADAGPGGPGLPMPAQTFTDAEQAIIRYNAAMAQAGTMADALGMEYDFMGARVQSLTSLLQELAASGMSAQHPTFQMYAGQLRQITDEMRLLEEQGYVVGTVMDNLGPLIAGALGGDIAAIAAGKAKQNALLATEMAVNALVASTNPLTAARVGPLLAASAKYAALAAAWGGLAAATGGSGGSGAGSASVSGARGGARSEAVQPIDTEVHIYFEGAGFSAVNPEVQRVVQGAVANANERYGRNARVRVHR